MDNRTSTLPEPALKSYLKKFPVLVSCKQYLWKKLDVSKWEMFARTRGTSKIDVLTAFPVFIPFSAGSYKDRAALTMQTINQTIPALTALSKSLGGHETDVTRIKDFPKSSQDWTAVNELKTHLDRHGSDKSRHAYHCIYGTILNDRASIKGVLEVGLGTNNTDVVSNMGKFGKPGASLRAFRDFLPNAKIFGADIDKRVLFEEERIQTYFVDQTDPETFKSLGASVPQQLDLIIDDGLHSPNANLLTLNFGLARVKVGGWVVIEDIAPDAIPIWQFVSTIMPSKYRCHILHGGHTVVFAVQRLT